jgi:hypothetical protein
LPLGGLFRTRLPRLQANGGGVFCRNAANNADLLILALDGSNQTTLALNSTPLSFTNASLGGVIGGGTPSVNSINVVVNGTARKIAVY